MASGKERSGVASKMDADLEVVFKRIGAGEDGVRESFGVPGWVEKPGVDEKLFVFGGKRDHESYEISALIDDGDVGSAASKIFDEGARLGWVRPEIGSLRASRADGYLPKQRQATRCITNATASGRCRVRSPKSRLHARDYHCSWMARCC